MDLSERLAGVSSGYSWVLEVSPVPHAVPLTTISVLNLDGELLSRDGFHSDFLPAARNLATFWGASTGAPQRVIVRASADVRSAAVRIGEATKSLDLREMKTLPGIRVGVLILSSPEKPRAVTYHLRGVSRSLEEPLRTWDWL